jgi:hypothetical protein
MFPNEFKHQFFVFLIFMINNQFMYNVIEFKVAQCMQFERF